MFSGHAACWGGALAGLCGKSPMAGVARSPMPSPWLERSRATDPLADAPAGPVPEAAEIVVVGGGLSGCSVAYYLAQRGMRCVLLEARTLAGGATGRNGGVFAASHSNPETWKFERDNIEELRGMLAAAGEECEQRTGGYLTVEFEGTKGAAALHERPWDSETEEFWDASKVASELRTETLGGERIAGALFRKDGGAIWPAKLVHALARAAASHTTFCTHTCALTLEPGSDGVAVHTDRGTIIAQQVVVCTNGWAPRLLPELLPSMYPVRNNVLLTAPVEKSWSWPGTLTVGSGPDEMYATRQPDGRIVIGGARRLDPSCGWPMDAWTGPSERPGQDDDSIGCEASAAKLREHLSEVLGNFGQELKVEAEWVGILGFAKDGKPLVGRALGMDPSGRVFVGAGFSGHGMPVCSGVGKALAAMLAGDGAAIVDYVKQMTPQRFGGASAATAAMAPQREPRTAAIVAGKQSL